MKKSKTSSLYHTLISENFQRFILNLFFLSFFLFRIPSFNLLLDNSQLVTTQNLSRILFTVIFLYIVCFDPKQKIKRLFKNKSNVFIISFLLLLFCLQTFSLIWAINITAYLTRFKDIVLGLMAFVIFYYFNEKYNKLIILFILSTIINLLYQSLIIFDKDIFQLFFSNLIYDKQFHILSINLSRDRIYIESYDEIIISLLLLPSLFLKKITKQKGISLVKNVTLFLIITLSFISKWRTRILMSLFSIICSIVFILKKNIVLNFILLFLFIILGGYIANVITSNMLGGSFIERLSVEENTGNSTTVLSRLNQYRDSIEIVKSSFFGVGLGNYYDYFPSKNKNVLLPNKNQKDLIIINSEYIHNNFFLIGAESGLISALIFLLLMIYFFIQDIKTMSHNKAVIKKAFIISFWTLFIQGMFNPSVAGSYQILFWGLRGLLLS